MKIFAWIGGVILSLVLIVYVVAFTSVGNNLLKPTIEAKIKESTHLDSTLDTFSLSMSDFEVALSLTPTNKILVKGNYSLFSQSFNVAYRVRLDNLAKLEPLSQTKLNGQLHTDGKVVGDMAFIKVDGDSDVAKSKTDYHVELTDLNPTSIIAKIDNADLKTLLYMVDQKLYASADVNLDINFKDITPHQLDGDIVLVTKNGKINSKVMKKDFNITIPTTAFGMNLDAKLKGDDVEYTYILDSNLAKISSGGKVVPEPLKVDIKYGVDIKELAVLKPITNAPLKGAFQTDGVVVGSKKSMKIEGRSNLAASKTTYDVELKEFKPLSVIAKISNAKLDKLLYMVGQPKFAKADLDMDVKLTSLDPKNLKGTLNLALDKGVVNRSIMKKVYKVNLPKTTFNSKTDVVLKGKDIDYKTFLKSNLAKITSKGVVSPETMKMDLTYGLNVVELGLLKPITGADLRGSVKLKGDVKGDKKKLVVNGYSDIASSDTVFSAVLKDFAPKSVKAKIKGMKLQKVLYMVKQPHYTDGVFDMDADITDASMDTPKGDIKTTITKGLLDSRYLAKAYKFKYPMPKTTYNATTYTSLDKNIVDTKVDFNSNLVKLDVKKARYDLKDSSIKSDYTVDIPNLDKLYFVSERHLKGKMKLTGDLKKAKDLDFTMHTKVAGGKVDAKLHNDDFYAKLDNLQSLDILDMLIYPKIFKSKIDGDLKYNLAKQSGILETKLSEGKFTKNSILDLTKQYAHRDLYKEKFKGDVVAKINKEHILANLSLNSNKSSIKTTNTKLNTKTKMINSKLDIVANKHPLIIYLSGDVNAPKVKIDASKIIEKEAGKVIDKQLNKLFKKFF